MLDLFFACFTGEMLLRSAEGKKRADAIEEGDLLWSRDEFDADGPLVLKRVVRRFERTAKIWQVRVAGQVLRTTLEHPFWVENRQAWLAVGKLRVGDVVRTEEGALLAVEGIEDSGSWEKVYNWEVEDYHTYFVSATEEAPSIWAHNTGETPCAGSSEEESTVAGSLPKGGAAASGGAASIPKTAKQQAFLDIEEEAIRTGQPVPGIHEPGPYAGEGIPTTSGASTRSPKIAAQNNANGQANGCHICGAESPGTSNGNWVKDHIPSTHLTKPGDPQMIFPSCQACSDRQGWIVRNLRALRDWLDIFGK